MNRTRVGTGCLIAAVAGFVTLWVMAYEWGLGDGLAVPEDEKALRGLARMHALALLGLWFLLPLALLGVGIRLVRPRPKVLGVSDENLFE